MRDHLCIGRERLDNAQNGDAFYRVKPVFLWKTVVLVCFTGELLIVLDDCNGVTSFL